MHTIPHLYTHPASREDATLPIYVGAYFLSNSLHLNARKYISHNIYTCTTLLLLLLVLPLFTTTLGCATTVSWLLLALGVTKEGRSLC